MNMMSSAASRSVKNVKPINALLQLISRQFSGCIQIMVDTALWAIYFDRGELIYGTKNSISFHRLEYYLSQIGQESSSPYGHQSELTSGLMEAKRVKERLAYEKRKAMDSLPSPDYQAICWLVDQKYLNYSQASHLIEAMTQEAIELLLQKEVGDCKIFKASQSEQIRKLCKINTHLMLDVCRKQAKKKRYQSISHLPESHTDHRSDIGNDQQRHPLLHSFKLDHPVTATKTSEPPTSAIQTSRIGYHRAPSRSTRYVIGCIDDSPAVLNSLRSCLDNQQFSVFTVDNPVKALMTIIRHKPDLILLDVMMPELDGYELCSLLRKHPEFKGIPIIIVTSNTGFVDRAKAKVVRASGYLTKPFTKEDLIKIISKYLKISHKISP